MPLALVAGPWIALVPLRRRGCVYSLTLDRINKTVDRKPKHVVKGFFVDMANKPTRDHIRSFERR